MTPPPATVTVVKGACPHDCPDTCALDVHVRDGIAVKVMGSAAHAPTAGVLCTKVARYTERTYHPDRLLHPMRRIGKKGEGRFERIGWEEAIAAIAGRLAPIAADNPERILPYSYAGTMGLVQGESMSMRFFHKLGASFLDRTICAAAGTIDREDPSRQPHRHRRGNFGRSRLGSSFSGVAQCQYLERAPGTGRRRQSAAAPLSSPSIPTAR